MFQCRVRRLALVTMLMPLAASAHGSRCDQVLQRLGDRLVDVTCVESKDLTTNNSATTPADNSLTGLPPGAFTPTTDRSVIAPAAPDRTPITKAVPGIQINGRIAGDPQGQARFLLRLPDDWNERLRPAAGLRVRLAEQGRPESPDCEPGQRDPAQRPRVPAQPIVEDLGQLLRQRSRTALHALADVHG